MKPDLDDVLALLGLGLMAWGAWLIYMPSAFLLAGAALLSVGLARSRQSAQSGRGRRQLRRRG